MVPIAHASDGGGSIRVPASCSGLVGLKVSQGRISVGPTRLETNLGVELAVSRSVRDIAALLDAVHGPGVGDTVIAPPPLRPYVADLTTHPGKLRIGFVQSHFNGTHIHPECATAVNNAAHLLESLGHHVELAFPAAINDPKAGGRFMTLWSTNMATSRQSISAMLGREVSNNDVELVNWVMAEYSSKVSALDYALAINDNGVYRRAVQQWWEDGWDILLTPTLAAPPLAIGVSANNPNDPMAPLKIAGEWMGFTAQFNTTGQPAISLPLHMSGDGLPVGVQLVGAYGREDILIRLAAQIETAAPWAHLTPSI
jgi:amidase